MADSAIDNLVTACAATGTEFSIYSNFHMHTPDLQYEVRIYDPLIRETGATAYEAAAKAHKKFLALREGLGG